MHKKKKKKIGELVGDKYIRCNRPVRWDVFCAMRFGLSVMVAAGLRCTGLRWTWMSFFFLVFF